ncbi:MAG TPA: carbamoyltransferase C-terminal domain-containing protein [Vicinamibacterales bacterium]|nr:carbamoyltransferase C-terminal domain-containing protein [Vicinamibacterales bacterium]
MKVLGISGRYRDAAAALAVDGRVIAAASEDCFTRVPGIGYTLTGGFPAAAVDACLHSAGLEAGDLDELSIVAEGGRDDDRAAAGQAFSSVRVTPIDAVRADAVQAAAASDLATTVLVCGTDVGSMAIFAKHGTELTSRGPVTGGDGLLLAARAIARTLGVSATNPYQSLDRLSIGGEPEFETELASAMRWSPDAGVEVDDTRLSAWLAGVGSGQPGSLSDTGSLNVRLQTARRAMAASFTCRLAAVLRDAATTVASGADLDRVAFGGAMFANLRLSTELRRLAGEELTLAAVPELPGRALGAALATASGAGEPIPGLALGPSFSDHDIKRTLDNCRLDYVYEPDWSRLFVRVSKMLAQGKVVGWFQGAMGFGPRAMGTRSILCDPSSRYARQNMNEYLRQAPLDEPLPVIFAPSAAAPCLGRAVSAPLVIDAPVGAEWRERLVAALDWRHNVRVHAVNPPQAPELCDVLECHFARTGVPALIEINLSGPGEPVACTPRDAVRTVYSSAIDALVLGRFVLMKDYWLLRNNAD